MKELEVVNNETKNIVYTKDLNLKEHLILYREYILIHDSHRGNSRYMWLNPINGNFADGTYASINSAIRNKNIKVFSRDTY